MFRKRWVRRILKGFAVALALAASGLFVDRYLTRRAGEKRLAGNYLPHRRHRSALAL